MTLEDGQGGLTRTKPIKEGDMYPQEAGLASKFQEGIPKKPYGGRRAYITYTTPPPPPPWRLREMRYDQGARIMCQPGIKPGAKRRQH